MLIVASMGATQAWAQSGREDSRERRSDSASRSEAGRADSIRRDSRAERSSSLSDAVRRVQRETGGQVLGAERVQFDGRDINRIKVMDDRGRVRYLDDDPQRTRGSSERRRMDPPREQEQPRPRGDNPSKP